jgi:hypothetical protein
MSKHSDLLLTLGLLGGTVLGLTGLYVWLGKGERMLPPAPSGGVPGPLPSQPGQPSPSVRTPIGVVQPMPQTRLDLGSSFFMVTGRNYKIFERPVDPSKLLPPALYKNMRTNGVFLDPTSGMREAFVTYTGPSDNIPFGAPQATGVFVAVQDDAVAI